MNNTFTNHSRPAAAVTRLNPVSLAELEAVEGGACGAIMLDLRSVSTWIESLVSYATSCYNSLKSSQ
jgi:hypothetical protein